MPDAITYTGHCHCGAVQLALTSEPITAGFTCNCSICTMKGSVVSPRYYRAAALTVTAAPDALRIYRFGPKETAHHFCALCGIHLYLVVDVIPPDYPGPARVGDVRVNLRCFDAIDVDALDVRQIDGRAY